MIFLFIISLFISIFLHELSHLIVAKLCKCTVICFSVGFGKPIYSFEWKGTRYNFTPFLLGGYTKLKGELDAKTQDKDAFVNLPYRNKLLIAIAGCSMNIISGLITLLLGLMFHIYFLYYFGLLSLILGITNLIPIPCLDGGYALFIPIMTKIYGKEKGMEKFAYINKITFMILMLLNILCIPWIIYLIKNGGF